MKTIELQNDISIEQYQMAVRVLEAIGIKTKQDISKSEALAIEEALKRADESVLISEEEAEVIMSKIEEKWS